MGLTDILREVASNGGALGQIEAIKQNAPPGALADSLTAALRSENTPAFPDLFKRAYSAAGSEIKAALLNRLFIALGPGPLGTLAKEALGGGESTTSTVTPDQAARISPEDAQGIAARAEAMHPGVANEIGSLLAQHTDLIKALGEQVMNSAIAHLQKRSAE
jgi:hypothetical protein